MTELSRSLDQKIAYGCKGPDPAAPTGSFGAQPFAPSQCQVAGRGPKPEFGQQPSIWFRPLKADA